ncbi:MAG: tRNA (adenosine(37)-N6)-dimethylallyltransferase MiaA [Chloroflexota bacterium]
MVILGPTAVGKTEVAIQLAERLHGEIVSADSRLFYRGMDIGTAKPTLAEQSRAPHHLINVTAPDKVWSLATFQRAAYQVIGGIQARGQLPFLVGGTGQYIRAVIEGWNIPEVAPDPRLRAALEMWAGEVSPEGLHARLSTLDPEAAARIDPQNLRRTVRAWEVILHTGKRFSAQKGRRGSPYRALILGLNHPRPELYERVDARIQAMLDAGLIGEVRGLLEQGYSPDLPPLSAIGYRQIIAYLRDEITLDEAVVQMKRNTRQFVRRQANWFKADDPNIIWFRAGPGVAAEMEKIIHQFIETD